MLVTPSTPTGHAISLQDLIPGLSGIASASGTPGYVPEHAGSTAMNLALGADPQVLSADAMMLAGHHGMSS